MGTPGSAFADMASLFTTTNYDTLLPTGTWVWVWIPDALAWCIGRVKDPNVQRGRVLVEVRLPEKKEKEQAEGKARPPETARMVVSRWDVVPYDAFCRTYQDALADNSEPGFSTPSPAVLEDVSTIQRFDVTSVAGLLSERWKNRKCYTSIGHRVLLAVNPLVYGVSAPQQPTTTASELYQTYALASLADMEPDPLLIARKAHDALQTSSSEVIVLMGPSGAGRAHAANRIVSFYCYEQLIAEEVGAALTILMSLTQVSRRLCALYRVFWRQRSKDAFPTSSFVGLVLQLLFDAGTGSVVGLKTRTWAEDIAPLSSSVRHKDEMLPHLFYSFLISVVALEGREALPVTAFLPPFDALAVLRFLPRPMRDEKETHVQHFRQVLAAFTTLGFSEAEKADVLRALFLVALIDAAYTSNVRGRATDLSEGLTSGSAAATLATALGIPDMEVDLQTLMAQNPDMLFRLEAWVFEQLMLYLTDRINDYFQTNITSVKTVTLIYAPGFTRHASTLNDLLRNAADEATINWFVEDHVERMRQTLMEEGVPDALLPPETTETADRVRAIFDPENGLFPALERVNAEFALDEEMWRQYRRPSVGAPLRVTPSPPEDPYTSTYYNRKGLELVETMAKSLRDSPYFTFKDTPSRQFAIEHTWGTAAYSAAQFIEDNSVLRLQPVVQKLLRRSDDPFLEDLMTRSSPAVSGLASPAGLGEPLRFSSLSGKVKVMIDDLSALVTKSAPCFYICCLRPNAAGTQGLYDINHVARTLRAYRIHLLCQLHQAAYPLRFPHMTFVKTFLPILLLPTQSEAFHTIRHHADNREAAAMLLTRLNLPPSSYWLGNTSVLLTRSAALKLERQRQTVLSRLLPAVTMLQRLWKTFGPRLRRRRLLQQLIWVQSELRRLMDARNHLEQKSYTDFLLGVSLLMRAFYVPPDTLTLPQELEYEARERNAEVNAYRQVAAVQLQAWWRTMRAVRHADALRMDKAKAAAIEAFRNLCRRYIAQATMISQFTQKKFLGTNTVLIQSHVRGWLQRRRFLTLVKLRMAVIPIKRIARRVIALQTRIHMLKVLSENHLYRNIIKTNRNLSHAAGIIQKMWRGHFIRAQYQHVVLEAIACQELALLKYHATRYQLARHKIQLIQEWWRAAHVLRKSTDSYVSRHPAVIEGRTAKPESSEIALEEYTRRELTSFNLLRPPGLLYQAFWRTSRLRNLAEDCLLFLSIQLRKPALEVYPRTWAWALQNILHQRAEASWATQKRLDPRMANLNLSTLLERAAPSGGDTEVGSRRVAKAALTHGPRILSLQQVSVGGYHSLVLLSKAQAIGPTELPPAARPRGPRWVSYVFAWGWNDRGQLGDPTVAAHQPGRQKDWRPVSFEDVTYTASMDPETGRRVVRIHQSIDYTQAIRQIGAGDDHCIAITMSGLPFAWGDNSVGQCGQGPRYMTIPYPRVIEAFRHTALTTMSVGPRHAMGLSADGNVYIWGSYAHVGLDTLPPQCNVYYPLTIPIYAPMQPKTRQRCAAVVCGHGFNVCVTSDPYWLKVWGRNDCGQLGLGQTHVAGTTVPTDLRLSDIPRAPEAYLRIAQVACGHDFVVACVKPSKGRVFLWGAFSVQDPTERIEAAGLAAGRPPRPTAHLFLEGGLRKTGRPLVEAGVRKPVARVAGIREPTAVSHAMWEQVNVVHVAAGYHSNVCVVLENGDMYGFNELQIQWYKKEVPTEGRSPPGARPSAFAAQAMLRSPMAAPLKRGGLFGGPAPETEEEKPPPIKLEEVPTLKGSFHLEPFLYQYRHVRPGVLLTQSLHSTFNSKGLQVDYVIAQCRHPELIRPKRLSETAFEQLLVFPLKQPSALQPPPAAKRPPTEETEEAARPPGERQPPKVPSPMEDVLRGRPPKPVSRGAAYLQAAKKVEPKKAEVPKHVVAPKQLGTLVAEKAISPAKKAPEATGGPPPLNSALTWVEIARRQKLRGDTPLSGLSQGEIQTIADLAEQLYGT